jgi:hypothetical protein
MGLSGGGEPHVDRRTQRRGLSMNRLDKFDIVIRCREDKVTASVPQLSLYATATDIPGALNVLEQKKAMLLNDLNAAGAPDNDLSGPTTPVAVAESGAPGTSQVLWHFMLKLAMVFAVAAVAIVITTNLITRKLEDLATTLETTRLAWQETLKSYSGAQFWVNIEKNLDQLAKSEISEEKREKILSDIRVIRNRWWPFIAEAIPRDPESR